MKCFTVIVIMLLLIGCTSTTTSTLSPSTNQPAPNITSAIYLVQGQGQLVVSDLRLHPEVMVTDSFDEFQRHSQVKVALWIDKNAIPLVNMDWLHQAPQKYYPLVLVGCSDALYSFRETLSGFGISGPAVDWTTMTLGPGFSVWMIREETDTSVSAFMKGYVQSPTVSAILAITDALLAGKPVE